MPEYHTDDTIAAIATPHGEGGIAVIRVSGPRALAVVDEVFRSQNGAGLSTFASHTIHLGKIFQPREGAVDQVLVSLFRAPNSYTAEDVVEINSHGGRIVTRRILGLLIEKGARHAEPGEFTKRAFLNGRIDLTQAEAVLDLVKAKSMRSMEIAMRQLTGSLSRKLRELKDQLLKLYAHLEADLDFPDEHLEVYSENQILENLSAIKKELESLVAGFKRSALIREGVSVMLVGKPNVGKSSLFNVLLEKDRALVSEIPGTTRDQLEDFIEIQGVSIRLIDTAGLGSASNHPLDRLSMARTRQILEEADLYLFLVDGSAPLDAADEAVFSEMKKDRPVLVLINKCDLEEKLQAEHLEKLVASNRRLRISTKTRQGIPALEKEILKAVFGGALEEKGEQITRLRHLNAVEAALHSIRQGEKSFLSKEPLEIVTIEIKTAIQALQELIGEVYSEDLLDVIFSEFCIGK